MVVVFRWVMNDLSGNVYQVDIVCLCNIEDWVTNKVHKSSHTYVQWCTGQEDLLISVTLVWQDEFAAEMFLDLVVGEKQHLQPNL
jgi:hypothetical protein